MYAWKVYAEGVRVVCVCVACVVRVWGSTGSCWAELDRRLWNEHGAIVTPNRQWLVLSSRCTVLLHAWHMRARCASRAWYVYGAWCVHGACISASIGANRTCAAAHAHALRKRVSGAQSLCAGTACMCEEVGAGDVV